MKVSAQDLNDSLEDTNQNTDSDMSNNLYKTREDRTNSFLADLHNERCSVYEHVRASTASTTTTTKGE